MRQFAVLNSKEKEEFEKTHQLPYGYFNAEIFQSWDNAIIWCQKLHFKDIENSVIEIIENGVVVEIHKLTDILE